MKIYKVVCRDMDYKLISCIIYKGKYSLKYDTYSWTESKLKGYGICCFKSLIAAKSFCKYMDNVEIWEVYYRNIRCSLPEFLDFDYLEKNIIMRTGYSTNAWPEGTVMCQKVKLKRRVL